MSNLPARISPQDAIIRIRGHAVILDVHLAILYGVETRQLNQQIKRNPDRFPASFAFQLTADEWDRLRSQIVISNGRGGRRYLPYAFTEHGVLMAANVLNSPKAIRASVSLVETFVKLRRMALSVEALARKVAAMESRYDESFQAVFHAIRELMSPPETPRKRIGFRADD